MGTISLLLDGTYNDLVLSASNDIAVASDPFRLALDAACAIRTFQDELYFDTTQGLPYKDQVLGHFPPISLVKYYMTQAALSVPGVASATVFIAGFAGRRITGQVQVKSASGQTSTASF